MAGLLEKDFRLIFSRWQTLIVFLICAIVIGNSMDGTFIIGYLSMLGMVLLVGTASYDELDNGMAFLFTLPVSRKTYVREKYIFCVVGTVLFWAIGMLFYFGSTFFKTGEIPFILEDIIGGLFFIPIFILGLCILLPIELILGSQKSRVGLVVFMGAIFATVFLSRSIFGDDALDTAINNAISVIAKTPAPIIAATGVGIILIIVLLSYFITVKGIERKEY